MRSIQSVLGKARTNEFESLEAKASEKRFAPRRKGQTPALIYFDGTTLSVPCMIRDMSTTGARLELHSGWDNPFRSAESSLDRIRLVVRMDRVVYDCRIVRREEKELGVKFTSAPKPMAKAVR
jgi:hypothetical protein